MPLNFGNPDFFSEMVLRRSIAGHRSQVHVLLHSTNGQDAVNKGAVAHLEPFSIGDILWLCRLPDELQDAVFRAREARGDPPEEAYGNPGQLYCVALFMGPILEGTIASWDGYGYPSRNLLDMWSTHLCLSSIAPRYPCVISSTQSLAAAMTFSGSFARRSNGRSSSRKLIVPGNHAAIPKLLRPPPRMEMISFTAG
jgi:hypothetical protein